MSQSPFHGIFGAFNAGQADKIKRSLKVEPEKEVQSVSISPAKSKAGQIAVDIYEHEDYYVVRAPIAGVKMTDIDIEVDGKQLTIKGRREDFDAIKKEQYFLQECFFGEFNRSIQLPVIIDAKKVKATFSKDSVLKIFIPKHEEKIKIVRVSEQS